MESTVIKLTNEESLDVYYEYSPAEPTTFRDPGCAEEFDIQSVYYHSTCGTVPKCLDITSMYDPFINEDKLIEAIKEKEKENETV